MEEIEKPKILIVDDRPENLLSLEILFENEHCEIVKASSGNEALTHVITHDFAVVLLDVQMPGMDGFETAELMRNNTKTENIPIIFVTAISKEKQHIFKGYEAGAVDYIFKPLEPEILKSKVGVFLRLYKQQKTLKNANQKIIEQQKSVIEEERLKVLLEMAGATAHELSQPLMTLLGSIELIEMCPDNQKKMTKHLARIKESGMRISEVIRKIQAIRHYDIKSHDNNSQIINLDQKINILCIEDSEDDFKRMKNILSYRKDISLSHAQTIKEGFSVISTQGRSCVDIIFLDYILEDGNGFNFMEQLERNDTNIPVVIITEQGDEVISSHLIQVGAYDYLTKSMISTGSLSRIINHTIEKSRLKMDLRRMQDMMIEKSTKG